MSFASERQVKATQKAHRCDACFKQIHAGGPAVRWSGMSDGEFHACIYHVDCREAELKLNGLSGYRFGDDWMGLEDRDHQDEPWLLEEFPEVAARLGIAHG